ncbi:MAG: hypothetical protein M1120_02610 [Patescibacteria group bacterium]|nr:hypothetical protein [Patescibacteria group bacterium]
MKNLSNYFSHIFRKIYAELKNTSVFLSKTLYSVIAGSKTTKQSLLLVLKQTNLKKIANLLAIGKMCATTKQNKPKILFSLGLLYLFFLAFPAPWSLFTKTKLQIYCNNNSSVLHTLLADSYLGVYDYTTARKELGLAMAIQPNQEIEKKLALVTAWETKPETLTKELASWQKITQDRTNYRDGFFQEALILYQLKRPGEAKAALKKVFELDPNFEAGIKLENLLATNNR